MFAVYLRPAAGRASRPLVFTLLVTEGCLALAFGAALADHSLSGVVGGVAAAFVVAATAGYAALLVAGQSAACHCFGVGPNDEAVDPAVRPALLAARNVCLLCVCLVVARASSAILAVGASSVTLVVGVGLVGSVVREHGLLRRSRHPVWDAYAPITARLRVHAWWVNGHPRQP